jgi:hypothetical protein
MTIDYYDDEFLKTCPPEVIEELYCNQYDESKNIPAIDRECGGYEEGVWLYKLYIYTDKNGMTNYSKYFVRIC